MKRAIALLCAMALSGCTTMTNGPMQRIYVDSKPDGAVVRLEHCGLFASKRVTTPAVAGVSRRSTQCALTFAIPEQPEQRVRLSRRASRNMALYGSTADFFVDTTDTFGDWVAVTALFLVPSFVVDLATGSMFEQDPNQAHADFTQQQKSWRDR